MKIIAINDRESSCQCCGKTGLKRVVWVEKSCGEICHYGTTCATKRFLKKGYSKIENQHIDDVLRDVRQSDEYKNVYNIKATIEQRNEFKKYLKEKYPFAYPIIRSSF